MNFSFLPVKVKKQIETIAEGEKPLSLVRSNTSIDGQSGECYLIAYKDKLFFFSRILGDHDYSMISGVFGKNVDNIHVRKDGLNTLMDAGIDGKKYTLKFSSFEEKNLLPIMESFAAFSLAASTPASTAPSEAKLAQESVAHGSDGDKLTSYMVGMVAALMFVAKVDDDIAEEEDRYIIMTCNNDRTLMKAALKYYKGHSFEELLAGLSGMNHEQKLCCLANMMEIGMADGALHRSEIKVIRQFCDSMQLSEDEYDTIKQVLLIKNKLSVL